MIRTFATRCAKTKISPDVLKKLLGHKNITVTMKYCVDVNKEFELSENKNLETYLTSKDILSNEY